MHYINLCFMPGGKISLMYSLKRTSRVYNYHVSYFLSLSLSVCLCCLLFNLRATLGFSFLKKWAKPGLFLFSFFSHDKYSTNDKSVLATRTRGSRMIDKDESTELRRHIGSLCSQNFISFSQHFRQLRASHFGYFSTFGG